MDFYKIETKGIATNVISEVRETNLMTYLRFERCEVAYAKQRRELAWPAEYLLRVVEAKSTCV